MPTSIFFIAFALHAPIACSAVLWASNSPSDPHHKMTLTSVDKNIQFVAEMESSFARSEEAHNQSMEKISKSLTLPTAVAVIQRSDSTYSNSSSLKSMLSLLLGNQNLRSQNSLNGAGFGGLEGARKLLNEMIYEAMEKYDNEIEKCTDYYAKQCALMEVARGQISAANAMAASSRGLILDAQGNIEKCQKSIPETKLELKDHNRKCKSQLGKMNKNLKALMGDIAVMTMILKMSDCDAKLLQVEDLSMLRCENECTKEQVVTFNRSNLQKQVNELRLPTSRDLIAEAFADFFDDGETVGPKQYRRFAELAQVSGAGADDEYDDDDDDDDDESYDDATPKKLMKKPTKKTKMKFNNPPVPRTKVPPNPCNDPNGGAPSAATKRAAKCTLKKSPQCYKLQGRFLQIQAEIADARDELQEQIQALEDSCHEMKTSLEASIANDNSLLGASQTKLAEASEKEAAAGEQGRQVAKENTQYNNDLVKQMTTCNTHYVDFETELCALKKIRGDLFKKMKPGHKGFFQDCETSKWSPEACTKKCAGGEQKLSRGVLTHPSGGTKCLPLTAKKRCNRGPCPVDCKLGTWGGWSKCSAKCSGGVSQRVRDVKVAMRYGGKSCSATSETRTCNVAACSKDCELTKWTKWTKCSKDCDGGTMKRQRFIQKPAEGSGKCAGQWSKDRLQYKACNMKGCKVKDASKVMKCDRSLDIVLLLDGTPKSGKEGWAAEVKAANQFVDAFADTESEIQPEPNFAVIHYTGPRTWSGVSKCTGKSTKKVDIEKDCKVSIASHFSEDMKKVKGVINGLQFQPGSKLLSLGLMSAVSELPLGRKTKQTIVVVFMDGQPLSYRKTLLASRAIRKKARLVYVVVTKFAPLKAVKTWASRRWQENVVIASSAEELGKPEIGTHLIANICPKEKMTLELPPIKGKPSLD